MKKGILVFIGLVFIVGSLSFIPSVQLKAKSFFSQDVERATVNNIPIIYVEPDAKIDRKKLVIWIDGFTGKKENTIKYLNDLAAHGFTAVSFDKYEHGERGNETPSEIYWRIQSGFKRYFWTILGHSSEDAITVMDWAVEKFDVSDDVCMGGFSMGGDISVSVAGFDKRVTCVAAVVTSPDWKRPGRKNISKPSVQKKDLALEVKAQKFYEKFDPMTHLDGFASRPRISFEMASNDTLIKLDWAKNFVKALKETYTEHPNNLRIVVHQDSEHKMTDEIWQSCLKWFLENAK